METFDIQDALNKLAYYARLEQTQAAEWAHTSETVIYRRCCVCKKLRGTKAGHGANGFSDGYCPACLAIAFKAAA